MIKFVILGVWTCLATLGSSYAAMSWKSGQGNAVKEEKFFGGLDYIKTDLISVPMIDDGKIHGYVIAQFVFTVEAKLVGKFSVPPNVFLVDEAFKAIYASHEINFTNLQKQDLPLLTKTIKDNVNKRLEAEMVEGVLIEQINYVPKAMSRNRDTKARLIK